MKRRISLFWYAVITLFIVYLITRFAIPYISMSITNRPYPLTVPAALVLIYFLVTSIGLFIYITTSEENIREFLKPIQDFLRGGQTGAMAKVRLVMLGLIPLLVGGFTYQQTAPNTQSPTGIRIQHPTIPKQFENLVNPYRNPDEEMVKKFIEDKKLEAVSMEEAKARLIEATLIEGRGLYQANCRPCHGSKAKGNGPMAIGFRLKPADFTDPGTIATVVEGYALWRIRDGGRGLPAEATPWDSAMPRWKDELTDDQIWKIIFAEYTTAGVEPRKPEKLH